MEVDVKQSKVEELGGWPAILAGIFVFLATISVCVGLPMADNQRIAQERIEAQHMVP